MKKFFALLIIIFLIEFISELYKDYSERKSDFIKKDLLAQRYLFDTSKNSLKDIADTIYFLNIDKDEIIKLVYEKKRKELYKKMESVYNLLKGYGIRQLHFHLPGSVSFLRMHYLKKYGDNLSGVRTSIDLVNLEKKIIRCFEEGRVFNGFRNVYPLFYKGKFVGSVEISFSAKPIIKKMYDEINGFYGLLISKKVIGEKVWKQTTSNYIKSAFKGFVWDKGVYEYSKILYPKNLSRVIKEVAKEFIDKKEDFSILVKVNGKYFLANFLNVRNCNSQSVGYLVSLREEKFFLLNEKQFIKSVITIVLFNILLLLVIYFLLNYYLKRISNLKKSSYIDPLTTLLNRRGFFEEISNANISEYSIIFMDIDKFKQINDKFGHDIGDEILKEVSKILKENLRSSDLIVRWGGEEFLIFLPNTRLSQAVNVAEKLRRIIENFEGKVKITSSFGVASGIGLDNLDNVIKVADENLYEAKRSGRNRVIYKM